MTEDNKIFILNKIYEAFKKVKSGTDFPKFVRDLKTIGVKYYDNYVENGRTTYYMINDFEVEVEHKYPSIAINTNSSADKLKHFISIHQHGQTDYPTFCIQAAEAGVEKWRTHIIEMTVTYIDKQGNKLIVEPIPQP